MSVFVRNQIIEFIAPLAISENRIGLQGSWSKHISGTVNNLKMCPNMLFKLRLHTWIQQIKKDSANACLDWVIEREDKTMQHYVILRFDTSISCYQKSIESSKFNEFIDQILNSSTIIWSVFQAIEQSCKIQQAQPGVVSVVGDIGKEGSE